MAPRQVAQSSLACMQCFKSKCKCVSRPDGDGCERCHRLNKPCYPSDPVRKSANAQRRLNSTVRISELEGKVDSLLKLHSLLARFPNSSAVLRNAIGEDDNLASYEQLLLPNDSGSTSSTPGTAIEGGDDTTTQPFGAGLSPTDLSLSSPNALGTTVGPLASNLLASSPLSLRDSETCLAVFRDKMLPSFSFIYISPDVTVQQLQRDRPFLFRAIIAVASPYKEQKLAYGRELKQVLAEKTIVQNQSSIDLLQGLLVFTAWSYDQVYNPSGTLSRLMLLAMSLAYDLRLDKPLPPDEHMMKPMVDDSYVQENNHTKNWFVAEEQKAVLACYVLSSIISIYFAQIDVMKWKPRMDESLRAIETNKECPADTAFAFQVRLQLLAQKAVQVREQRGWDSARTSLELGPALSANLYIRALQAQLNQLGDSLPMVLQQQGTLKMHMHYIELCLNEMARTSYPHVLQGPMSEAGGSSNNNNTSTSEGSTLDLDYLDFSWRSVGIIKTWMDVFFSLPLAECAGLSFIHAAQLARCLMVLYRLSTFAHPNWDCHLVRSKVDILMVLDRVADKLEMASREAGEQSSEDVFMHLAGMMRKFRTNAAAKMDQKAATVEDTIWLNSGETIGAGGDEAATIQSQMLLQPMITDNDAILENIFGNFENGWGI